MPDCARSRLRAGAREASTYCVRVGIIRHRRKMASGGTMRVLKQLLCLLAAIACIVSGTVHAQNWPSQPIRIIVPFPPGGTTDQVARLLQPYLQQAFGVSVV